MTAHKPRQRGITSAITEAFTLPTSVTTASGDKCGLIASAIAFMPPTGVHKITSSAPVTASAKSSVASSTAPATRHSSTLGPAHKAGDLPSNAALAGRQTYGTAQQADANECDFRNSHGR